MGGVVPFAGVAVASAEAGDPVPVGSGFATGVVPLVAPAVARGVVRVAGGLRAPATAGLTVPPPVLAPAGFAPVVFVDGRAAPPGAAFVVVSPVAGVPAAAA